MPSPVGGDRVKQTAEAEHLGPDYTGDNISAKRVATYVFPDGVNWGRAGAPYTSIVDDSSTASVVYIGAAVPGSAKSDAVWQIQRFDVSAGAEGSWADGDALFNNVWDDRTSITYS